MHCDKGELSYLAQHFFVYGGHNWGHSRQFNVFRGGQEEMCLIRKILPAHP